jgi:hypothetical protein
MNEEPKVITATAYTAFLASSELSLALRSKLFRDLWLTNLEKSK